MVFLCLLNFQSLRSISFPVFSIPQSFVLPCQNLALIVLEVPILNNNNERCNQNRSLNSTEPLATWSHKVPNLLFALFHSFPSAAVEMDSLGWTLSKHLPHRQLLPQKNERNASSSGKNCEIMPQPNFCIVFDCDGVLVNSEPYSCESLRQAILRATGVDIPHKFPNDYFEVFGLSVYSSIEYYVKKGILPENTDIDGVARKVNELKDPIYEELARGKLSTFPGLKALLEEACAKKVALGVGSSGTPEKIRFNLKQAGILSYFKEEHIVSSTQVARGKPAPDVYLKVMELIGCPPEKSLVIEDACAGLLAAKNAGACAIGITTSLPRQVLEPFADIVLDSFEEMSLGLLERLVKEKEKKL